MSMIRGVVTPVVTERRTLKGMISLSSAEAVPELASELSEAVERIIERTGVAHDSNPARLLDYVVTETANGRADRLKAFTIAQDVFRRGDNFDASNDSIVRVEMKRLREILDHYYATVGEEDPVRISVPKGTYVPQISRLTTTAHKAGEVEETSVSAGRARQLRRGTVFSLGAAGLCAMALFAWMSLGGEVDSGEGEPSMRIEASEGTARAAYSVAVDTLSHFSNIELSTGGLYAEAGRAANYQLILAPAGAQTLAQLRVNDTGEVISSRVFSDEQITEEADASELSDFEVWLGQVATRNGLIEADFIRRGAYSGDFACSVLTEAYFTNQTDARHLAARDCILERLSAGHDSARLRIDLAKLYREEHSDQRNLMPGDPLMRAAREARAAIALDRFDANAYYALMSVLFALGATEEGIAMGERSLELNPFDGEAVGGFAARINIVGQHERALELFEVSRRLTPGGVAWRDYGYFLAHLGLGDLQAAAAAGIGLRGSGNELYLAAVAISASIRGDEALARETKQMLLEQEPDIRWMYERRAYDADLIDKIMMQLEAIQV
ncbi:hypothetical protein HKCCSP123_04505 [Rhodobacterales bacterium HKCCSP123]|nr:hypothetical protein [Rhodobacterales bacterium HKCCSP123]